MNAGVHRHACTERHPRAAPANPDARYDHGTCHANSCHHDPPAGGGGARTRPEGPADQGQMASAATTQNAAHLMGTDVLWTRLHAMRNETGLMIARAKEALNHAPARAQTRTILGALLQCHDDPTRAAIERLAALRPGVRPGERAGCGNSGLGSANLPAIRD